MHTMTNKQSTGSYAYKQGYRDGIMDRYDPAEHDGDLTQDEYEYYITQYDEGYCDAVPS